MIPATEFEIHYSQTMITWHRAKITLPPTIVRQCDAIRNHAAAEGHIVWGDDGD